MKDKGKRNWVRLDNASKIFPATCNNKDSKVFRLSCELKDHVEPTVLQEALDRTIKVFPHYCSVMRRGIFWYYLEESDIQPIVTRENLPVCAPIYQHEERNLLFRVMYYRRRISLEIFHALADGTGGVWFLQVLIYYYLLLRYPYLQKLNIQMPVQGSLAEKLADSYRQFSFKNQTDETTPIVPETAANLTRLEPRSSDEANPRLNWLEKQREKKRTAMQLPPHKAMLPKDADAVLPDHGGEDEVCVAEECTERLAPSPRPADPVREPVAEETDTDAASPAAPELGPTFLSSEAAEEEAVETAEPPEVFSDASALPAAGRLPRAYRIKGRPEEEHRISVLEAAMPLQQMLDLSRRYNVTLTVFQVALFIYAIGMNIPEGRSKYPITVSVPVDLRQRFPSSTARNFFCTILISYEWHQVPIFEKLVQHVAEQFEQQLQPENLRYLLNKQSALSRNPLVRIVPINIKDYVLRAAHRISDRHITAAVSNVGRIQVDDAMADCIYQFSVMTGVRRPQFCTISFADRLVITFTSPWTDMEIQRHFLNFLTKFGVEVTIASNVNRKPDQHTLTLLDGSMADSMVTLGEELHAEIL